MRGGGLDDALAPFARFLRSINAMNSLLELFLLLLWDFRLLPERASSSVTHLSLGAQKSVALVELIGVCEFVTGFVLHNAFLLRVIMMEMSSLSLLSPLSSLSLSNLSLLLISGNSETSDLTPSLDDGGGGEPTH